MKMVKSLLLGSAAGLVAVAAAQAADLPVKAKPVQYVRICSLYGVGFYYIPGTDTCIKIGGFVRAEVNINAGGSFSSKVTSGDNMDERQDWQTTYMRARGGISMDARSQTGYGTLRAYWNGGITSNDSNAGYGSSSGTHEWWRNRAFIQWAGFTFGLTDSFFDFDTMGYSNQSNALGSSVSGSGIIAFAYTAQFGNGVSGSISAESSYLRSANIYAYDGGSDGYAQLKYPDFVANLRVDQGWGSAQIMGAIHTVRANGVYSPRWHPSNAMGYAVGAGLKLNLPMLGHGDYAIAQVTYAHGANDYVLGGFGSSNASIGSGNWPNETWAYGPNYDATYDGYTHSSLDLTDAWGITGGYEHHWNPQWKTSIYGAYSEINYSDTSSGRIMGWVDHPSWANADWSMYQIGTRTVWTPVKNLDFSLEVMYSKVNSATTSLPWQNGRSEYGDVDWWSGIFRVQRNFYP